MADHETSKGKKIGSKEETGASPQELVIEAARRDNTELLHQVITRIGPPQAVAQFLNRSTDPLGKTALHTAASSGSYEVLDVLLDQEGLEVDPQDRREGETPLHKAVHFINGLEVGKWKHGQVIIDILLDAGADPRIRNKTKSRAVDLVDPRNQELRSVLQRSEYQHMAGGDLVVEEDDVERLERGSASDDDKRS